MIIHGIGNLWNFEFSEFKIFENLPSFEIVKFGTFLEFSELKICGIFRIGIF